MFGKLFQTIIISFIFLGSLSAQEEIIIQPQLADKPLPFGLTEKRPEFLPKIGLALSGGGARGFAQIGVLKALKENNIYLDLIAGTSMGSIIGGLYASGYSLEQIDSIMVNTDWDSMFQTEDASRNELYVEQKLTEDRALFELRLDGLKPILPNSLIAGQKVANFLNLLALNAPINIYSSFDDFVYDYKAVCTDLVSGDAIVFNNGTLAQAMRASSSVTLLLPPVKKDSMLLVDGGLVANIPTKIVKENNADITIAVNTTSPLRDRSDLNYPWNYADQIVSIPMSKLNAEQLQLADIVIKPVADTSLNTDFAHAQNLIDAGYRQANSLVSIVKNMIKSTILKRDTSYFGNMNFLPFSDNSNEIALAAALNKYDYVNKEIVEYELFKIVDKDDFKNITVKINKFDETFLVKIDAETNQKIIGIFVNGCNLFNIETIKNLSGELVPSPWNSKRVLEFALDLLRKYRSKGYSLAKILSIDFTEEGQLIIQIDEGIIGSVNVVGNTKTNQTVITREFPFEVGDIFKYKNAFDGLTNLRSTNLFEDFEIEIDSKNDIILRVLEKPSSVFRFGLRIDNEYQTQMAFDIRDENIFGTGTDLGLIAWGGLRNRVHSIEHRANRIFDTYLTYKIRGFYEFQDINTYIYKNTSDPQVINREKEGEYRQIFYGVSLGVGTQVQKFGNVILEAKYQVNEVKNKDNFLGQVYKTDIFSLRFGFSIDSQDRYPFPNSGFLVQSYYETAQKILGADLSYSKLYIDYKSYFKFGNYSNISPRIQFGFADETLPLSQQFSMGGQYSFFGYREFEFRGRQKLVASLEYRLHIPVKLFFDAYIKARYDLGSIWASREQIRFKDLKHGIGLSLSFDTPVGPAEFAVGKSFIFRNTLSDNQIVTAPANFYFRIGYYY